MPAEATFNLNQTTVFSIHFSATSAFSTSQLGKILTFIVYAFRDVAVMLAQLVLNIISIILFKRYSNQKNKIANAIAHKSNENGSNLNHNTGTLELAARSRIVSIALAAKPEQRVSTQVPKKTTLSKSDTNMTIMVIVMCLVSFLVHFIMLVSIIYPVYYFNIIDFILYFVIDLCLPLKTLIDFFLFFFFNKKFKRCTLKLFSLSN
jgi:hypothetical protein